MSTLQCANIHFESTQNNRVQYFGANNFALVAGGSNALSVNTSVITVSPGGTTSFSVNTIALTVSPGGTTSLLVNTSVITVSPGGTTVLTVNSSGSFDAAGSLRGVPINSKSATYELTSGDNGETISTTAGVTVNGSVLSAGQIFTIFNNSAASITITQGAGTTMYLGGTATTGNRTLAQRGLASVLCVAASTFVISGVGLT